MTIFGILVVMYYNITRIERKVLMKGLVFFDLDGTLLNGQSAISENVAQAVRQLKANGFEPVIASGRTHVEIIDIMKEADIESAILMNGQFVLFKGQPLIAKEISKSLIADLSNHAKKLNHGLALYNDKAIKIVVPSDLAVKTYDHISSPVPETSKDFHHHNPVYMGLIISESGQDESYTQTFPQLRFVRNAPYSIDVIHEGVSKALGIQELLTALEQEDIETYAFGDGLNDLEMFQVVDHPIAMGNAIPQLKEIAEYITGDHKADGIVSGLKHYDLI